MMGKLKNKVVLITGAASGIGRAQALLFAAEGAKIIAADLNLANAVKVADEIISNGQQALPVEVNVANSESIQRMVQSANNAYGKIDVLCNTAGIHENVSSLKTTEALWDKVMDINLKGVFLVTNVVLPQMIETGHGVIINMASRSGLVGGGGGVSYTSSKHAVIGFTKQMVAEYAKKGIRANAIAPGVIHTPMMQSIDASIMENIAQLVPSGRIGQPEEIARVSLFLASDDSSYIYGETIVVDGGAQAVV